jgi:peptidoglycan/LPS O-acetylase OafA/YrhL
MRDRIEAMLLDAGVRASSVGTVFTLGYFPSVLLLAFLSYHALEEPFLRLKRHFRSPGGDLQATR